ncbi:MAG: HlyD family efflux transporter periplasmic adaptor subunit [Lachnospiraceae bacterium]|nr:HlyD family efflux transporter periplasmic adaptor subunit [Lachnospiraceae bacterium]
MSELNNKIEKQEEKTGKKRDIIKNIAIIFLAVMLVLTFFSNTIMNYSLPQVSTEQIMNGTIKNQVRGKGIIEVVDPYNVVVEETRTVSSVRVQEGDLVNEGDVIYTLKGEESEELEEARKNLATAEDNYKKALLDGSISPQATGAEVDLDALKRTLAAFDAAIDSAQKDAENHDAKIKDYERQLESIGETSASAYWNAKKVKAERSKELAERKKTEAEGKKTAAETKKSDAETVKADNQALEDAYQSKIAAGDIPDDTEITGHAAFDQAVKDIADAQKAIESATKDIQNAEKEIVDLDKQLDEINYQIDLAGATGGDINQGKIDELNNAIRNEKAAKESAEAKVKEQTEKKEKYVKEMTGKVNAASNLEEIVRLQDEVAKLEKKALGGEVTSPVTGKIISLAAASGEKIEAKQTVATIQVEGKGYQCILSADARQAKTVKVGDEVKVEDYYYYNVTAKLVNILPDKSDPKNKRSLVFELEGDDLYEGGSISLAVGESNSRYDLTIPKSALGKDNKGDYILVLVPKQVPFGTRYIAKRVEVTSILATDDSRAAIEAEVDSWGTYVITNATRPVNPGEQVRLAEEKN